MAPTNYARYLVGILHPLHNLEEEPLTPFALVDDVFQQARGCNIFVIFTYLMRCTLRLCQVPIVLHQPAHHLTGLDKFLVVIGDALQLVNMRDRADGCATYTPHPFSQDIDSIEYLIVAYPDEPLRAVVYRMAETGFTRFPVVRRDNPQKLLGIVSLGDLLKARTRNLEEERQRERVLRMRLLLPRRTPSTSQVSK